jgi:hypothetical protein
MYNLQQVKFEWKTCYFASKIDINYVFPMGMAIPTGISHGYGFLAGFYFCTLTRTHKKTHKKPVGYLYPCNTLLPLLCSSWQALVIANSRVLTSDGEVWFGPVWAIFPQTGNWMVQFGPGFSQTEPKPIKRIPNGSNRLKLFPCFWAFWQIKLCPEWLRTGWDMIKTVFLTVLSQSSSKMVQKWVRYDKNKVLVS